MLHTMGLKFYSTTLWLFVATFAGIQYNQNQLTDVAGAYAGRRSPLRNSPAKVMVTVTTQATIASRPIATIMKTSNDISERDREVIGDVLEVKNHEENEGADFEIDEEEAVNQEMNNTREGSGSDTASDSGSVNDNDNKNFNDNDTNDTKNISLSGSNSIRKIFSTHHNRRNDMKRRYAAKKNLLLQQLPLLMQHNNRKNSQNLYKFNGKSENVADNSMSVNTCYGDSTENGCDIFDGSDDIKPLQQRPVKKEQQSEHPKQWHLANNNDKSKNSNNNASANKDGNGNNANKDNNNKQITKFSKYKTNDGDSMTSDLKRNLQRLLSYNNNHRDLNNVGISKNDSTRKFDYNKADNDNEWEENEEEEGNEMENAETYRNFNKIFELVDDAAIIATAAQSVSVKTVALPTKSTAKLNLMRNLSVGVSTSVPTQSSVAMSEAKTIADSDSPHSTPMGRRHIVPGKLQYTHEITIKQGRLKGIRRTFHTNTGLRDVDQYLGLPYAEAPVGNRRFMPPGTPLTWSGLRMAHHLPPVCPQRLPDLSKTSGSMLSKGRYMQWVRLAPYLKNQSEDCLFLNVYVPSESDITASLFQRKFLYPVVVYIHGESFEWNSGNAYDGSVLASYGEIIVVTVNYRLGVLGFMRPSLNEKTVANFGLLDQIAALQWIQENIAYFGGDKDSVTLMGHSTGAACINYLMISPVASGLFHRAILMSGSATSDWAYTNTSLQQTMQIAQGLNCPLNGNNDDRAHDMLTCLRKKSYEEILRLPITQTQFSTSLGPIVDGHVIPDQPYKVMSQFTEYFGRYDLLFGITESESYHLLGAAVLEEGLRENERDNLLRFYMQSRFDVRPDLALAATLKKYSDMYTNPIKATKLEHRDVALDVLSDARVVGPLLQTGLFHSDVNRHNYMYVFGHNSFGGPHASLPHSIAGEELPFIFGAPLATVGPYRGIQYNPHEKLLAEAVISYWSNFIKTGNPKNPWKGTFINLHALEWDRYDLDWPEFNKRTQAYMNIGMPPSIGYKYRQIYMNFWNKELPDELNHIADMQKQPEHYRTQEPRLMLTENVNGEFHQGAATSSDIITGQVNKFDSRNNDNDDPIRTLRLLLHESSNNPNYMGIKTHTPSDGFNRTVSNLQKDLQLQMKKSMEELYYTNPLKGIINSEKFNSNDSSIYNDNGLGGSAGTGNGDYRNNNSDDVNGIIYGIKHSSIKSLTTALDSTNNNNNNNNNYNNNNQELVFGKVTHIAPVPVPVKAQTQSQSQSPVVDGSKEEQVAKSETTLHLLIGLIVMFIILNIVIYSTYLLQKRRKTNTIQRKLGGCVVGISSTGGGGILSYDGTTDDELKRSKPTTQYDEDESYIIDILRKSNTYEPVKMERSPMNNYKITRQLSCSTVDTHTKVCEWMEGKVLLSNSSILPRRPGSYKSSKKSSSFSSLVGTCNGRSGSAGSSFGKHTRKVSVAVDATSQGRGNSVLEQEPIEITKLKADGRNIIICQEVELSDQDLFSPQESLNTSFYCLTRQNSTATEPCDVDLCQPLHKYSRSDPIDMCYNIPTDMAGSVDETVTSFITSDEPSLDINVTSREEAEDINEHPALTHEQQILVIKRRKYPKVLPTLQLGEANSNDSPPMTQDLLTTYKRNSLPPHNFHKQPPLPPPRTVATLGRRTSFSRPSSSILASSPLMLACDYTEEEEEPIISKNTLIVGSLAPNPTGKSECYYSTLKREKQLKDTGCSEICKDSNSKSKNDEDIENNALNDNTGHGKYPSKTMYNSHRVNICGTESECKSVNDPDEIAVTAYNPNCYGSAPVTPNVLTTNAPQMQYPSSANNILVHEGQRSDGSLQQLYAQAKKSQIPRMIQEKSQNKCPSFGSNDILHSVSTDKGDNNDMVGDTSPHQVSAAMTTTHLQQSLDDMTRVTINESLLTSNPSSFLRIPHCSQRYIDVADTKSTNNRGQCPSSQHINHHSNNCYPKQHVLCTEKMDTESLPSLGPAAITTAISIPLCRTAASFSPREIPRVHTTTSSPSSPSQSLASTTSSSSSSSAGTVRTELEQK